jgi:hypothetical protein
MFLLKIQNTRVLKIYDETVRVAMVLAGVSDASVREDEGVVLRPSRKMDELSKGEKICYTQLQQTVMQR